VREVDEARRPSDLAWDSTRRGERLAHDAGAENDNERSATSILPRAVTASALRRSRSYSLGDGTARPMRPRSASEWPMTSPAAMTIVMSPA
jgi:hypothetical protein